MIHGVPQTPSGTLTDLLYRDKARKMTMVVPAPGKDVQEAVLDYALLASTETMSKIQIWLHTGRTHQIRVQFSSRGLPLVGERKYSQCADICEIALWSYQLGFYHPKTGIWMQFSHEPPTVYPWNTF